MSTDADPNATGPNLPEEALGRRIPIQLCALTGFRHHDAPRLWPALRGHDPLTLVRETDNPHDPDAVALVWKGHKLGYLPRGQNFVVARLLDGARPLSARVESLRPTAERNRRIRVEVVMH
jgi:hypothetical protein